MKHRLLILLLPALLGCGSGSSTPAPASPPKDTSAAPAPAEPVVKIEAPPAPPRIPDAAPPSLPKSAAAPAPKESSDNKPASAPSAPDTAAPKKSGKPDEFDPTVIGGKPIATYVKQLDSANKDDVIEALEALKQVPKSAEKYQAKITDLSKSKDKDIADEAALTLKAISGK